MLGKHFEFDNARFGVEAYTLRGKRFDIGRIKQFSCLR